MLFGAAFTAASHRKMTKLSLFLPTIAPCSLNARWIRVFLCCIPPLFAFHSQWLPLNASFIGSSDLSPKYHWDIRILQLLAPVSCWVGWICWFIDWDGWPWCMVRKVAGFVCFRNATRIASPGPLSVLTYLWKYNIRHNGKHFYLRVFEKRRLSGIRTVFFRTIQVESRKFA
jgi:hypothetical protein